MTFSIYDASFPVFKQGLKNLSGILSKAQAHAAETGIAEADLLKARLSPDMFDLKRQVQLACDHAKGGCGHLAGAEVPPSTFSETSIADLQLTITQSLEFIKSLSATEYAGGETRDIELKFPWATLNFTGQKFLTYWAIPNFFFHTTTAYDILRAQGVPLGKADFLGGQ